MSSEVKNPVACANKAAKRRSGGCAAAGLALEASLSSGLLPRWFFLSAPADLLRYQPQRLCAVIRPSSEACSAAWRSPRRDVWLFWGQTAQGGAWRNAPLALASAAGGTPLSLLLGAFEQNAQHSE